VALAMPATRGRPAVPPARDRAQITQSGAAPIVPGRACHDVQNGGSRSPEVAVRHQRRTIDRSREELCPAVVTAGSGVLHR
jgi:hypothetical protein